MTWDASKGRPLGAPEPSFLDNLARAGELRRRHALLDRAFQEPKGYYGAFDKAGNGGWAALWLAISNLVAAWFLYRKPPVGFSIAGQWPHGVVLACLAFAALGFLLTLAIWRSRPLWAAIFVLAWVVLQAFHPLTRYVYGAYFPPIVTFCLFILAVEGVRGALALRDTRPPSWTAPATT